MYITKETRNKIGLMIFGLTLFPVVVHWLKKLFMDSSCTILDYYEYFYSSLLDMGMDGMVAWGIACGPYMVYEIALLVRGVKAG
ncbi:MAG: hypothetical protein PVG39_23865 [Desulfobacteraceae bacterium]|jgi:hypothetical protein